MDKKRVLVFPCGSEIGLEVHRSLKNSKHFEMYGASSVDDHGWYVYGNYIGGIDDMPSGVVAIDDTIFFIARANRLKRIVKENRIDLIIPAHDDTIIWFAERRHIFPPEMVVSPPLSVCETCRAKSKTYALFPELSPRVIGTFPQFAKPDRGNGSKNAYRVDTAQDVKEINRRFPDMIFREYLPGKEFTVDCFTDRFGELRFCEGRSRDRIKMGIAVETRRAENPMFRDFAEFIMDRLEVRGAWFFQVKEDANGELALLEIAPRIAGSSGLWRAYGINLVENALFDRLLDSRLPDRRFRIDTGIKVSMSRSLEPVFAYNSLPSLPLEEMEETLHLQVPDSAA